MALFLVPCLIALASLPGWSFYYDVIPKAAAVLFAAAALSLGAVQRHEHFTNTWTSRAGRWNALLTLAALFLLLISTLSSPVVPLAWGGSAWRRSGALVQAAILVTAFLAAALARSPKNRLAILRGFSVAGILAALYGVAQYFGVDPWLDASAYHFGDGVYQIVRPPGPMGHSNYLAAFLLWPIFCGAAIRRTDRALSIVAVATGVVAIILCGSRGAFVGLVTGALVFLLLQRPRMRSIAVFFAAAALLVGAFYMSPLGERLRARVFWIGEDSAGGSRLLLWRDSLRMGLSRPLTGFGPDTFAAEFPKFQSADLSRRFPDFYHESPHNLFLDALVAQGVSGVLLWCAWIALGIHAARRALPGPDRDTAAALLAGLAASLAAHQFAVLIIPTALAMFTGIGLLTSLDATESAPMRHPPIAGMLPALGILFVIPAVRLLVADHALYQVQQSDSVNAGERWRPTNGSPVSADLYFSRVWTGKAAAATTAIDKLRWSQIAGEAALAATRDPEQQQNAWYNLAMLQATTNDATQVEQSLRSAIAAAPTWFKPHWTLARLLAATGRVPDARAEARLALDLNARRDAEVIATMEEILRSAPVRE